ncbi:MAG: hypothetical protein VX091_03635, partial [Pseudomonadota bacterium]|nr:hypothetical protein [Pseudomonadota bacterium]
MRAKQGLFSALFPRGRLIDTRGLAPYIRDIPHHMRSDLRWRLFMLGLESLAHRLFGSVNER